MRATNLVQHLGLNDLIHVLKIQYMIIMTTVYL